MNTANLLPYFLAESSEVRPTTATNYCLLVLEVLNAYLFQGKKKALLPFKNNCMLSQLPGKRK